MTDNDLEQAGGFHAGDVLAGKYQIDKVLGVGGMGVVVAAHHLQLDVRVAIKFLLPAALGNAELAERFSREARAAVRIRSEHVARVIDVGTLDNGAPYMVMEFLEGADLSVVLQQEGALAVEQAVEFVLQACEAIAEAHGLGIVHRDLKPANLFRIRRADGLWAVKVLDFGISKLTGDGLTDVRATATNAVFGTPLYMSPEQMVSARNVDFRTDIWALGAILFELLTRRPPFVGESFPDLVNKVSSKPPPPLNESRPDVPPGIEAVIQKCLEKDRNSRYSNVAELAAALLPFAPKRARPSVERISRVIRNAGLSVSAAVLPPSSDQEPLPAEGRTEGGFGQTVPPNRQRRRQVFALLGGVLVASTALTLVWARTKAMPATSVVPSAEAAATVPPVLTAAPPSGESAVVVSAPGASEAQPSPPGASSSAVPTQHTASATPKAAVTAPKKTNSAPSKPGCDPPYRLDSNGRKRFKPECF